MSRLYRSLALAAALLAALALAPRDASADFSQLCRSLTTIALAPTDLLFGPITTAEDMYIGIQDQDDHWLPLGLGIVPGYAYLLYVQGGGTLLRVVAGVLEFIPGLFTLPRETSPKALFASQDEAEAVISEDYGPCPVRIGVHYNTIPWG